MTMTPSDSSAKRLAIEQRSFFATLFDTRFTSFATPRVARVVYVLLLIFIGLGAILGMVVAGRSLGGFAILGILAVLLVSFAMLLFARVHVEITMAFFAGLNHLREIDNSLQEMARNSEKRATDDVPTRSGE